MDAVALEIEVVVEVDPMPTVTIWLIEGLLSVRRKELLSPLIVVVADPRLNGVEILEFGELVVR